MKKCICGVAFLLNLTQIVYSPLPFILVHKPTRAQEKTPDRSHIISSEQMNCTSFCNTCYDSKTVCAECQASGHVSYVPSLLACDSCIERNIACTRWVVMVLCSDCITGNKSAFERINEELEKGTIDPQLEMLCTLPDCPHVGKSIKAAFSN